METKRENGTPTSVASSSISFELLGQNGNGGNGDGGQFEPCHGPISADQLQLLCDKIAKLECENKLLQGQLRETNSVLHAVEEELTKMRQEQKQQQQKKKKGDSDFDGVLIKFQQNAWDAAACPSDLTIIGPNSLIVHYEGNGNSDCCSVFAKCPIPHCEFGIFYFEVRVENVKGCIGVGLATKAMPLCGSVGFHPNSCGYYGNSSFWINGCYKEEKPTFSAGDVVGCGVNLATRQIILTRNGRRLDASHLPIYSPIDSLFPCVTLGFAGDKIEANFGPTFEFNLADV